jgi:uncharacterized membrane protein
MLTLRAAAIHGVDTAQVGGTRVTAAFAQAVGDFGNNGVQGTHDFPSRS